MPIRRRRGWELPESAVTPESVFLARRRLIKAAVAGPALLAAAPLIGGDAEASKAGGAAADNPWADLYPVERNPRFTVERAPTPEALATTYNNFYEFGSHKTIWRSAQKLPLQPWLVRIDGMVETEITLDFDELVRRMPLEERIYRLRCVEAWAMVVPWSGFPLAALVDFARPLGSATYLRMETFKEPTVAPGQRQFWYPWPYVEGLRLDEARNELAFIATGLYGKPLPKQNGAPLRLVVPWKYGFKSIKSVVRFTFTDEQPLNFWQEIQGREYGFWANVNPEVPHPRWSQATERVIGTDEEQPTRIYNGYGEFVAALYAGMDPKVLFY